MWMFIETMGSVFFAKNMRLAVGVGAKEMSILFSYALGVMRNLRGSHPVRLSSIVSVRQIPIL